MAERLRQALDVLLKSYSQILFAEHRGFGLIVLAASLVVPTQGLAGLVGALSTNAIALAFGFDRATLKRGLFGYNGVLLGIALGAFYAFDAYLFALLLFASALVVFTVAGLGYALWQYFGLPVLSLPFTLVTWIAILTSLELGNLHPAPEIYVLPVFFQAILPDSVTFFFSKFSAVLFQANAATGAILFAGLMLYSRISAVLMAAGLGAAYLLHGFLGLHESLLEGYSFALTSMFSALAIGGVFTVPGPGSLLAGAITGALSVLILGAASGLLPDPLSPLTLPFSLTVLMVLLGLRLRSTQTLGLRFAAADPAGPEGNLRREREWLRAIEESKIRVSLPFSGCWKVTQGIDGEYTHREEFNFAYDFEATDSEGSSFSGLGTRLEDYHSFGKPVLAPADGTVRVVESEVVDNLVGKINIENNWGNYVIIEHAPGWYSCVAHLKRGSLRVCAGDVVRKGQVIGACGNSGRSPYPHLHMQFQALPVSGAATIPFNFFDVALMLDSENHRLLRSCRLSEGWQVRNPSWLSVQIPRAVLRIPQVGAGADLDWTEEGEPERFPGCEILTLFGVSLVRSTKIRLRTVSGNLFLHAAPFIEIRFGSISSWRIWHLSELRIMLEPGSLAQIFQSETTTTEEELLNMSSFMSRNLVRIGVLLLAALLYSAPTAASADGLLGISYFGSIHVKNPGFGGKIKPLEQRDSDSSDMGIWNLATIGIRVSPSFQFEFQPQWSIRLRPLTLVEFGNPRAGISWSLRTGSHFSWLGDLNAEFPLMAESRSAGQGVSPGSYNVLAFGIPETRLTVGAHSWFRFYPRNLPGKWLNFYGSTGPLVEYSFNRSVSAHVIYWISYEHLQGNDTLDLSNVGTEIQPGLTWRPIDDLTLRPFMGIRSTSEANSSAGTGGISFGIWVIGKVF